MQTDHHHKLHVAIIMDGNGRWAEARGMERSTGHEFGADSVKTIVRAAISHGIGALTLYAFSTYNWQRPQPEVAGLMSLLRHFLLDEVGELRRNGVRISVLGRRDRIPLGLARAIAAAERDTAAGTRLHLRIAIDYSARDQILAAAHHLSARGELATSGEEDLDLKEIATWLGTEDVDFLIRTGGDQRLSDFLLWECAQAELYFTRVQWPDFGPAEFDAALADYAARTRSFGALPA